MAQKVRSIFDVGGGSRAVADPRQEEARAREASRRADKSLQAQMAAQLVNQYFQRQGIDLQRQQMAQQESQFSRGQEFSGQQAIAQRAWDEQMRRAGFAHESSENALSRGQQERQFNRQMGYQTGRDTILDDRYRQGFEREGRWRGEDVQFRRERATTEDTYRRDELAQRGSQFETAQRNDLLRFLADFEERRQQAEAVRGEAARGRAIEALGPDLPEVLRSGEQMSDEQISQLRYAQLLDPSISPEIQRILSGSQGAVDQRYEEAVRERPGPRMFGYETDVGNRSAFRDAAALLGLRQGYEEERDAARSSRERALVDMIQTTQGRDFILEILQSALGGSGTEE